MLNSLQYVALTVPNLQAGRDFYNQMGLQASEVDGELVFRCNGRAQDQIRLIEGAKKRIHHVCFGTSNTGLQAFQAHLEKSGVPLTDPGLKNNADGIWFRDVDGDLVNVRVAANVPQKRESVLLNNAGDFKRITRRGAPNRRVDTHPRRLGHLLKFTPNVDRTIDFYTRVVGMKLSDRIGDLAAFVRFAGDSDHHVLAIARSEHTGLHHMSFEMGNIDQIQLRAEHMIAAGYRDGWGFGRHIYGSNYFHYIRDPWNSLVEFFWDIDFIAGDGQWDVENCPPGPESLYQWATTPPPDDFLRNYEVH
jgi:catechol 2,3-dioxygenase-like lactoylglutathione lyase family enzyme